MERGRCKRDWRRGEGRHVKDMKDKRRKKIDFSGGYATIVIEREQICGD